jgi:hypothetical protein
VRVKCFHAEVFNGLRKYAVFFWELNKKNFWKRADMFLNVCACGRHSYYWKEILLCCRVFKKSAPNNKLTIYLSSRDLVVSHNKIDRLQGVLLVDPDYLQDRKVSTWCLHCAVMTGRTSGTKEHTARLFKIHSSLLWTSKFNTHFLLAHNAPRCYNNLTTNAVCISCNRRWRICRKLRSLSSTGKHSQAGREAPRQKQKIHPPPPPRVLMW